MYLPPTGPQLERTNRRNWHQVQYLRTNVFWSEIKYCTIPTLEQEVLYLLIPGPTGTYSRVSCLESYSTGTSTACVQSHGCDFQRIIIIILYCNSTTVTRASLSLTTSSYENCGHTHIVARKKIAEFFPCKLIVQGSSKDLDRRGRAQNFLISSQVKGK